MSTSPALPIAAIPEEAARLSGLSKTEIYALVKTGTLKAKRSGRRTLVLMDSVVRHIESLPDKRGGDGGQR